MKPLILICAIALLSIIVVLTPWLSTFYGPLPNSPDDWSSFGSYFGGTLSPIIAIMALIGLLYTINQQQKQISNIANQATKDDLFRIIEKIEKDFYENLNQCPVVLETPSGKYQYSAVSVLLDLSFFNHDNVIFSKEELKEYGKSKEEFKINDSVFLSSSMFSKATSQLKQIRKLVRLYDTIAKNNILSVYYITKFNLAFERLHAKGLMDELWEQEKEHNN